MTRANELQKNYCKTHNNNYTARESNNFNKNEKLYDAKKCCEDGKKI